MHLASVPLAQPFSLGRWVSAWVAAEWLQAVLAPSSVPVPFFPLVAVCES